MSGWLLMGLPGTAYLLGSGATNAIWTAIGLALGTYFNWLIVAKPLRNIRRSQAIQLQFPTFCKQISFKIKCTSYILGVVYFDILYGLYIVNVCGRCEFV